MQVGSSGPFVRDLAGFLSDSAAATHNLAPGLEAVMHILRNVIAVGGTFLPELASSFSQSAKEAAHFIQVARNTGQLQEWIQGGIDRVRQLWQALKDIGFILGQVADVTREIFPNWGAGLDSVTGKWREFIVQARESGRLREWLQTGYEALQQIGRILGDIGSIFVSLADSPVSFLDVIEAITSALSWIATNVPFLIPLIGALFVAFKVGQAVVGMIQLVKLLTSAAMVTRLWTAAFWLLNAAWLASPIGLIVLAIGALVAIVAVIIYHWDTVKSWFTAFWDWATGFFSRWGPDILMFLMPFIGIPLWIYQNWDMIRGWLGGIWDWAVGFFGQWGPAILALLVPFIGIPLLIYQHWDQITGWLGGIWDAVWGKATEVWDAITGVISRNKDAILDVLATLGRVALAVMTGGLSEIIMLVVRNWDQIVEFFKAAPGRIGDALKALPGQMADIGKGIITGIGRGLENGWNWLLDKVRNLAKSLFDAAKAALGIGSPSRLFDVGLGRWLPPGVVQGVERALPAARRAIAGLMRGLVVRPSLDTGAIGGPGDRLPPRYGVSPEHRQQVERTITEVGTLVLNIAGNLDPTNPVAWRQALENLRSGIRSVERSYA